MMFNLLLLVMLFQPQLHWADQTTTQHGKAAFVKGPNGCVVALTDAQNQTIYPAPAHSIHKALVEAEEYPLLQDAIGKNQ